MSTITEIFSSRINYLGKPKSYGIKCILNVPECVVSNTLLEDFYALLECLISGHSISIVEWLPHNQKSVYCPNITERYFFVFLVWLNIARNVRIESESLDFFARKRLTYLITSSCFFSNFLLQAISYTLLPLLI